MHFRLPWRPYGLDGYYGTDEVALRLRPNVDPSVCCTPIVPFAPVNFRWRRVTLISSIFASAAGAVGPVVQVGEKALRSPHRESEPTRTEAICFGRCNILSRGGSHISPDSARGDDITLTWSVAGHCGETRRTVGRICLERDKGRLAVFAYERVIPANYGDEGYWGRFGSWAGDTYGGGYEYGRD